MHPAARLTHPAGCATNLASSLGSRELLRDRLMISAIVMPKGRSAFSDGQRETGFDLPPAASEYSLYWLRTPAPSRSMEAELRTAAPLLRLTKRSTLTDEVMVRTRPAGGVCPMTNRAGVFPEETRKLFCEIQRVRRYAAAKYAVSGPDGPTGRSVHSPCRTCLATTLRSGGRRGRPHADR